MKHVWRFGELLVLPSLWTTGIFAAISINGAVLANDHSLCGPWGRGPASDAILAIHLAWIAAICEYEIEVD